MNGHGPQDRRTARTEAALVHALLELIEAKSYDRISVGEIADRADVGRSTFYAHFQGKDDLLRSGLEHRMEQLAAGLRLDAGGAPVWDTRPLFRHARQHADVYRSLVRGSGYKLLIESVQGALSEALESRLTALAPEAHAPGHAPAVPLPVLARTLSGGLLVLLKWWLDDGLPHPPERMDAMFQALVMPGVRGSLP